MESKGEVYDLGYQHYDGPREGRARARRAIFWNGVRSILGIGRGPRAKILPILLFVAAMTPAFVFVMIVSVVGTLAVDAFVGPSGYYFIISIVMIIFSAIMAPELLAPDRRDRVIDLYLVRPLTSTDYVLGRVLAFFVIVLALAYSGQIVLQIGLILGASDPLDYIRDNWLDIPRFLAAGALLAAFITLVPMAVAAFTTRRAYAAAFVIGLFFVSTGMGDGLTSIDCHRAINDDGSRGERVCEPTTGDAAKWFALLSVRDVPLRINNMIFDVDPFTGDDGPQSLQVAAELNDAIPIAVYGLFTVGPWSLIWWQYRRIRL